jgi:predicted nuclease of predicted toxin-antitoxin system
MDRVRFLLDEHVPHAIAEAPRRRGIDVLTAREASLLGASDDEYLERSCAEGRVLVTHDSDFLRLHQRQEPHAGIVYCQHGSRTIGQIITGLVVIYEILEAGEMAGQVEFL